VTWRRLAIGVLVVLACFVCTLVLLRLFYTTPAGAWLCERIPEAAWRAYEAWYGPADGESAANREAWALAALALGASIGLVGVVFWSMHVVLRRAA
jgi:hypothetical protein